MRLASPATFALAIICFFLPFTTLSCSGQKIETFSGIQLVTGTEIQEPVPFGQAKTKRVNPEPLALLAFLSLVGGLGLSFFRARGTTGASAVAGGLACLFLLALKSNLTSEVSKQAQGLIQISFEPGFYLALIFSLLAAVLSAYFLFFDVKEAPLPVPRHSVGPRFCTQCGSKNGGENLFCEECGTKFA
jgi:hypothetical protein